MRLSTRERYAVRAMVDLALYTGDGPVTREEIAARQDISTEYLAHLFAKLVQAGLVSSTRDGLSASRASLPPPGSIASRVASLVGF